MAPSVPQRGAPSSRDGDGHQNNEPEQRPQPLQRTAPITSYAPRPVGGPSASSVPGPDSGPSSNTNRAPTSKPKVQQLKPSSRVVGAPPSRPVPKDSPSNQSAASEAGRAQHNGSSSAGTGSAVAQRTGPRIVTGQGSGNTIIVNPCQKGNPLLQHVRQVGWEYGEITADYLVGVSSGVLFLSLRYHRLHPEYVHSRIAKIRGSFSLRILLVLCDVDTHETAIKELTKVALVNSMTLMLAWTAEEAGKYVEAYKLFEHRPPDVLRERVADDYLSHIQSALTNIRGVNKTDVITLATNFGSFKKLSTASAGQLSLCPGFGDLKARRLREAFALPFRVGETRLGRDRIRKLPSVDGEGSRTLSRAKAAEAPRSSNGLRDDAAELSDVMNPDASVSLSAAGDLAASQLGAAAQNGASDMAMRESEVLSSNHAELDALRLAADAPSTAEASVTKNADASNISFNDELQELTEEEQLRLALEMSVGNELDDDDENFDF